MDSYIPSFSEILAVSHSRGADSDNPSWWNGLVGAWPFQAGGGATTFDVSGYGNDGTLTNMDPATDWVPASRGGRAIALAGSNQTNNVGNGPSLDITGNFTISAWIKPNTITANQGIAGKHDGSVAGYFMVARSTGKLWVFYDNSSVNFVNSAGSLAAGVWQHVAGTWDGSDLRAYIEGKPEGSSAEIGNPTSHASDAYIGTLQGTLWDFVGQIGPVSIHNRNLTPSEIQQDSADPWAMYRLRRRVFAVTVAGVTSEGPFRSTFSPAFVGAFG